MLPESKTVNKLLTLVGRGGSHVSVAHDIAQTVRNDGLDNPALAAFTSCGTFGINDQNTERDMQRWLRGLLGVSVGALRNQTSTAGEIRENIGDKELVYAISKLFF